MSKKLAMVFIYHALFLMSFGNIIADAMAPAPDTIEQFGEIVVRAHKVLPTYYNQLTPAERVFIYYLIRASLPGNRIAADQIHRTGTTVMDICETILKAQEQVYDLARTTQSLSTIDLNQFFDELKIFLAYLWTNHGQYFGAESTEEKRTPHRLHMTQLTQEHCAAILTLLGSQEDLTNLEHVATMMFDETHEPTNTVPNSINASAVNMYAPDFTDDDFAAMPLEKRTAINTYFVVHTKEGTRTPDAVPYKIGGKYDQELRVAHYWLSRALNHAKKYPEQFDQYIITSLEWLITFIETGDEKAFKKHSKAWLKSHSRVDYTWGFIETYRDPKSYRGTFEAEVSIKTVDIKTLNGLLPAIEKTLPLPEAYKREPKNSSLPNASINIQVFGAGELGSLCEINAYCLPNYDEIRAKHGSKQIIYHPSKTIGELINPSLYRQLFMLKDDFEFLTPIDPDGDLDRDIWILQCILHETLGHGSGKLGMHTFAADEHRTIGNVTYAVGQTIPVTSDNLPEFLGEYTHTLEELRAEIISVYASVFHYDAIAASGLLNDWPTKIAKDRMLNYLIINMATTGLTYFNRQQENATTISGDHARANYTLLNYLIDGGGIVIREESKTINGQEFVVIAVAVTDTAQALASIAELVTLVQTIKSTGDGIKAKELIETYGVHIRNMKHFHTLKRNLQTVVDQVKVRATLYPLMQPVQTDDGTIYDVTTRWPEGFITQEQFFRSIALETK